MKKHYKDYAIHFMERRIWKPFLLVLLSALTCVQVFAQSDVTIKGMVVSTAGDPVIGAKIAQKGVVNKVAITDAMGLFSITVPQGSTLEVSYIGYIPQTINAEKNETNLRIAMREDMINIDNVVVTGVARATKRENMTITVEQVKGSAISEVPQVSVASALQGKLPGVKIYSTSGNPTAEPVIELRGGMSFFGNAQPLIIVDGVMTSGVFKDINMEDVQSLEVIKGAAAASLYGAKAAAGVIQIITKRGSNLAQGSVRLSIKNETGVNWLGFRPTKTTSHGHVVDEAGRPIAGQVDPDQIWDNPYIMDADPYNDLFKPNVFTSTTVGIQGRSTNGDINYYGSIQSTVNPGVVSMLKGTNRNSFRLNLDAKLHEKVKFSSSNLYVRTINDNRSINFDDIYYADPNANFMALNLDGTEYKVNPNTVSTRNNVNPLYQINNSRADGVANRFLGNYRLDWAAFEGFNVGVDYSVDYFNWENEWINPKGLLTVGSPEGSNRTTGSLGLDQGSTFRHSINANIGYVKQVGEFNLAAKLMYLYEDALSQSTGMSGSNLAVNGMDIINMSLADPKTISTGNSKSRIVSNSFTAMIDADWKEAILVSGLFRYDGSSLIGANDRWQPYFRVSAAWNIHKTFPMEGIQMLKPRISYGTAGILPGYGQIFETFNVSGGQLSGASQLGNSLLRPALSQELEVGLDIRFLERFQASFMYSHKKNTDFAYNLPVSNAATGFSYQYMNIGEFFVDSYEFMLNANVLNQKSWSWDLTLSVDHFNQRLGDLGVPDFKYGEGIWVRSNSRYGDIYTGKLATSLDQVKSSTLIKPGQSVEDVYTINNYGWVVRKDYVGTQKEARISQMIDNPEEAKYWNSTVGGTKQVYIGNMNPDFTINLSSTLTWKNLTLYFTGTYQQGGMMFNNTYMYMSFAGHNNVQWEMADRPWDQRKAMGYASHSRGDLTENTSFFKLRELSLNYTLDRKMLTSKNGKHFFNSIKFGVNARNLFVLTNYSGPDPETRAEGSVAFGYDTPKYPSDIRNVTGTITLEF